MPFLIFLLVSVLIWMAVTFRSRKELRDCRWRENRARDGPEGRYYLCVSCGAEAVTTNGKPPPHCLKPPQQNRQ